MTPRRPASLPVLLSCLLWSMAGLPHAQTPAAAPAAPAVEEEPAEAPDPYVEEPEDYSMRQLDPEMRPRLDRMLPVGRTHYGIRMPVYFPWPLPPEGEEEFTPPPGGVAGVLKNLTECASATRIDDRHIYADKVVRTEYNDDGTLKMKIEMEDALLDLELTIISSNRHVRITTPGMVMEAGGIVHDGKTGLSVMDHAITRKADSAPVSTSVSTPSSTPGPENAEKATTGKATTEPESEGQ